MSAAQVAIVVPLFNGSRYIREAILAIHAQTFRNWRLYIVDDKSSDDSLEIVRSIPDPRQVIVQHNDNAGLYARLAEVTRSLSELWTAIVMQDDRPEPNWLESLLSIADRHSEAQAFWATEHIIDSDGLRIRAGSDTGRIEQIEPGFAPWHSILRRGCIWQISGSLTKSELFRKLPFDPALPHCGDYDWLLRAIRISSFVYYERPLLELRIHPGQASTNNLASAKDVVESYSVLKNNLSLYPRDLTMAATIELSATRARIVLKRLAAAVFHRRVRLAMRLALFVFLFAIIFLVPLRGRASNA